MSNQLSANLTRHGWRGIVDRISKKFSFLVHDRFSACHGTKSIRRENFRKVTREFRKNRKIPASSHDRSPGEKLLVSRRLASCKAFALSWRSLPFIRRKSDCVHGVYTEGEGEKERERERERKGIEWLIDTIALTQDRTSLSRIFATLLGSLLLLGKRKDRPRHRDVHSDLCVRARAAGNNRFRVIPSPTWIPRETVSTCLPQENCFAVVFSHHGNSRHSLRSHLFFFSSPRL